MTFYKALNGTHSTHGGSYRYPGVGRWTKHLDPNKLDPCRYGYHLAKDQQVLEWLAPTIYVAEPCPIHPPVDAGDKWVTCRVRLVEKTGWDVRSARLFAADCAETVIHLIPESHRQPFVTAIEVARRFANGDATDKERAAARDAARAAARAAIRDATRDAARAAARATTRDAAWAAARAATWDAARATARDAARDAAWDAARADQYQLFLNHIGTRP